MSFYLHIEIQNNVNSFCENEIFIKITHLSDLIGQVDLLIVKQTCEMTSSACSSNIPGGLLIVFVKLYQLTHMHWLYKSHVILKPKTAAGRKKVFWNLWSKPLKNTCEEVHFLIKLQVLDLQLKWAPSKVFLKYFDHRSTWLLFRTHIVHNTYTSKYLQWLLL